MNYDILERLKQIKKLKTDADVAKFLNIKPNTLSNWKKRNSYDLEKIITKCAENNVDLNWLLTGSGEMLKNETKEITSDKSSISSPEIDQDCKIKMLKEIIKSKDRIIEMQDARLKELENKQSISS